MLYMVEMDLDDPQISDWHNWYRGHIQKLLRVPGITAAQRFHAIHSDEAPYLAIYHVTSEEVLRSGCYLSIGGPANTGAWRLKMVNWQRNLHTGEDAFPAVAMNQELVVYERRGLADPPLPDQLAKLAAVGLDQTVLERALEIIEAGQTPSDASMSPRKRIFRPLTECLRA